MSEKAVIKIVQIGTVSHAKARKLNSKNAGKRCKSPRVELSWYPRGELVTEADDTPAEAEPQGVKKPGAMRRVRQWFGKRFGHKGKKNKGNTDNICQSPTSLVDAKWAELRQLEADIAALHKEQGVKDAEWRTLTLQLTTQQGVVGNLNKDIGQTAQLKSQLSQILLEQIELEEKSRNLKKEFNINMDNRAKPKMVSVGVQTDNISTEKLNSCYTVYKTKVAQMKEEILAHTEQLNELEQLAANERKNRPAGDSIKRLKVSVEDIFCTQ